MVGGWVGGKVWGLGALLGMAWLSERLYAGERGITG